MSLCFKYHCILDDHQTNFKCKDKTCEEYKTKKMKAKHETMCVFIIIFAFELAFIEAFQLIVTQMNKKKDSKTKKEFENE